MKKVPSYVKATRKWIDGKSFWVVSSRANLAKPPVLNIATNVQMFQRVAPYRLAISLEVWDMVRCGSTIYGVAILYRWVTSEVFKSPTKILDPRSNPTKENKHISILPRERVKCFCDAIVANSK